MTSSPPGQPQHFRGKSLSPESPVPVHLPEPHNIPVLQNQIDPVFNLLPTNMAEPELNGYGQEMQQGSNPQISDEAISSHMQANSVQAMQDGESDARMEDLHSPPQYGTQSVGQTSTENAMKHDSHASLNAPTTHPTAPYEHEQGFGAKQNSEHAFNMFQSVTSTEIQSQSAMPVAGATTSTSASDGNSFAPNQPPVEDVEDEGVNYQALLDNLNPSVPVPLSIDEDLASKTMQALTSQSPSDAQTPLTTLPVPAGLPARPPPQENSTNQPNHDVLEVAQTSHNAAAKNGAPSAHASSQLPATALFPLQNGPAANGMDPPPLATFQQAASNPASTNNEAPSVQVNTAPSSTSRSYSDRDAENVRHPDVEAAYQEFLRDEARNTSSGQWERFPAGSRLFIGKNNHISASASRDLSNLGNLFTERVTKRDLFFIFHKYGRLAQISMKSAYGFVQYVTAEDCRRAMETEQGLEIKGRKISRTLAFARIKCSIANRTLDLEISKPQKNTRNAAAAADGGRRRSRSPESRRSGQRGQGSRAGCDRSEPMRGRDDYRPGRSPSPSRFRARDSYRGGRERSPDRYHGGRRSRSRSPYGGGSIYRERSPRTREIEDEADLPIARRHPGTAPDVQIILAEEVDR